ncbi:uncharacterized protein EI90DRAFT_3016411 [Cantharellus anzutake]|uniref:uncharacterized protein n=1 Tax=Cantharellus anzutake TaxID=1750568 RepID=UPI0019062FA0|nr:uncharacterized protein EI90DRAFT_3016411 [Cantharellus anzutake]KAF8331417.1 hypothetical protein EI90DRAFT_3016411 [Cantharellus anzutake]
MSEVCQDIGANPGSPNVPTWDPGSGMGVAKVRCAATRPELRQSGGKVTWGVGRHGVGDGEVVRKLPESAEVINRLLVHWGIITELASWQLESLHSTDDSTRLPSLVLVTALKSRTSALSDWDKSMQLHTITSSLALWNSANLVLGVLAITSWGITLSPGGGSIMGPLTDLASTLARMLRDLRSTAATAVPATWHTCSLGTCHSWLCMDSK